MVAKGKKTLNARATRVHPDQSKRKWFCSSQRRDQWKMMKRTVKQNKMGHLHQDKDVISAFFHLPAFQPECQNSWTHREHSSSKVELASSARLLSRCTGPTLRGASCFHCFKVVNTFGKKDVYFDFVFILPDYLPTLPWNFCTPPSPKGSLSNEHNPRRLWNAVLADISFSFISVSTKIIHNMCCIWLSRMQEWK